MRTTTGTEQGDAPVAAWRCDQLVRAGFTLQEARRLAQDPRYDLHALLDLVHRGCAPALAARILAPLDEARAG